MLFQTPAFSCVFICQKDHDRALWVPFTRALISCTRAPPFGTIRTHLLMLSHQGLGFNKQLSGGHIQSRRVAFFLYPSLVVPLPTHTSGVFFVCLFLYGHQLEWIRAHHNPKDSLPILFQLHVDPNNSEDHHIISNFTIITFLSASKSFE